MLSSVQALISGKEELLIFTGTYSGILWIWVSLCNLFMLCSTESHYCHEYSWWAHYPTAHHWPYQLLLAFVLTQLFFKKYPPVSLCMHFFYLFCFTLLKVALPNCFDFLLTFHLSCVQIWSLKSQTLFILLFLFSVVGPVMSLCQPVCRFHAL